MTICFHSLLRFCCICCRSSEASSTSRMKDGKPCSLLLVYECLQSLSGLYSRVAANMLTVNAVSSVLVCVVNPCLHWERTWRKWKWGWAMLLSRRTLLCDISHDLNICLPFRNAFSWALHKRKMALSCMDLCKIVWGANLGHLVWFSICFLGILYETRALQFLNVFE